MPISRKPEEERYRIRCIWHGENLVAYIVCLHLIEDPSLPPAFVGPPDERGDGMGTIFCAACSSREVKLTATDLTLVCEGCAAKWLDNVSIRNDGSLYYRPDEVEIDRVKCRIRVPDFPDWINVDKEMLDMPDGSMCGVTLIRERNQWFVKCEILTDGEKESIRFKRGCGKTTIGLPR